MVDSTQFVSCHPVGDYLADDIAADAVARINTGLPPLPRIAEIFPSYQYQRPEISRIHTNDDAFRSTAEQLYSAMNRPGRISPAVTLVRVDAATILRNVVYSHAGDVSRVVYETFRPNDRPYIGIVNAADAAPIAIEPNGRKFFFIGSAGSHNYGHWLVDDLPRLAAFDALRAQFPADHIVIVLNGYSTEINSVRLQGIEIALASDKNYTVFFIDPHQSYSFESVFYCSPTTYHPTRKSPAALASTRSRFVKEPRAEGPPLFVARKASRGRALTNADDIQRDLAEFGFVHIDPDGMSFADQVDQFARAPAIVGVMGAAMTNTMFCQRGSKLIYLAPDGWIEPFYWDLAAVCGQAYQVCFGAVPNTETPRHLSDFTIDRAALREALREFSLA